jgi:hypothetical protein
MAYVLLDAGWTLAKRPLSMDLEQKHLEADLAARRLEASVVMAIDALRYERLRDSG